MSGSDIGNGPGTAEARSWAPAALSLALSVVAIAAATLAGAAGTILHDAWSGALEAGARAPGDIEALSAVRLGAYFGAFQIAAVVATLLFARILQRRVRTPVLPLAWPRGGFVTLALSVVGLLALATAAGLIVYQLDKEALSADLKPFAAIARSRGWWVLLLAAGVGAPLAEELLFRGFLYSGLRASPLGFAGTALVTAVVWTSLHMTYSAYGLALLLMIGLYFAWLRERSGSVWPSIAAHAVYNGVIVVALSQVPEQALALVCDAIVQAG